MSLFNQYTEHLKRSNVPLLGLVCWYSVPESSEISHKEFMALISLADAPIKPPEMPRPADVFRRGCNKAKLLKVSSPVEGEFFNYTMRDSGYDEEFVFRSIVEEKVDAKSHVLDFRSIGKAIFSKSQVSTYYEFDYPEDDPGTRAGQQMSVIVDAYVRSKAEIIPAIQIREAARKAVEVNLQGTRVRPGGGVYFITMERATKLESVNHVINEVQDATFHILPLPDDKKQREMLKSSFEDESLEETRRLSEEVAELLRSGNNIPAKKFLDLNERFQTQKSKLKEYRTLLSDTLDVSATAIDVCNAQLVKLLDKSEA